MKYEEIGEAKKVETVDLEAVVHVRGNAGLEADLIRRLQDDGKGQAEIGRLMGLSQGAVSKRLALFGLIPKLLERLRKGEIGANVAYRLAKLPKAEQAKFAAQEKVTLKAVDARHREIIVSDDLKALLAEPLSQAPVETEGFDGNELRAEQLDLRLGIKAVPTNLMRTGGNDPKNAKDQTDDQLAFYLAGIAAEYNEGIKPGEPKEYIFAMAREMTQRLLKKARGP